MEENQAVNPSTQQAQQLNTPPKSNKFGLYLGLILIALMTCAGIFLILQKPTEKPNINQQVIQNTSTTTTTQPTQMSSPATSSADVDSTLNNTDAAVQKSIDQAATDLNSINNIDNSQDSTNGL